jgi:hypothetical protein
MDMKCGLYMRKGKMLYSKWKGIIQKKKCKVLRKDRTQIIIIIIMSAEEITEIVERNPTKIFEGISKEIVERRNSMVNE